MDFDLFDLIQILTALTLTSIGLIVFLNQKQFKNKNGHYTVPEWNFFMKKWWAEYEIRKVKDEQRISFHDLKNYANEDPKILQEEDSSDSQLIYGSDQDGNSLLLKITRRRHRISEVWLILRMENGQVYTLPNHPDTRIANANTRQFDAAGVRMECLVPFSRWRITFNGLLRSGSRKEYSGDIKEDELKHVKFNFIWATCSDPLHWPYDWSPKLMATSLATEPWRDGNWMKMILMKNSGGYDQFGALFGQVFIQKDGDGSEMTNFDLNLPGLRQRRWGPHKVAHLHRTGSLIGVCHDGSVFLIGAYSSKTKLTHSQFGILRSPNGQVHPVDWMNFHLSNLGECPESLPPTRTIRFSANNVEYTTTVNFQNENKIPLIGGRPFDWQAFNIPLQLGLNGCKGNGIAMLWYPYSTEKIPSDGPKVRRVFNSDVKPHRDTLLVPFNSRDAQSVEVAGGKGASLALLTVICEEKTKTPQNVDLRALIDIIPKRTLRQSRYAAHMSKSDLDLTRVLNMPEVRKDLNLNWQPKQFLSCPDFKIPKGFILSVSAFDLHMEKNPHILKSIEAVQNIAYGKLGGDLNHACDDTQNLITQSRFEKEITDEIDNVLNGFLTNSPQFAVRSSSTGEDGGSVSFAGQNETILGVRTRAEIANAIRKCWASVYTLRSVMYRKQNIQPIKTGIAVVIQEMVDAEAAGVLFTNEPSTGCPNKILITANYGLGESVVSGQVDPDVYLVHRGFEENVSILKTTIGKKDHQISLNNNSGIETVEIESHNQDKSCVSTSDILRLAEIGIALEKMYGTPRDIEWAIYRGDIYLLQSRPITSLNNFTDWELLHEFDAPIMSPDDLRTIANVGEVIPGVVSPLTIYYCNELDKGILRMMGIEKHSSLYPVTFNMVQHHLSMEVYSVFFRTNTKQLKVNSRILGFAVVGRDFITDDMFRIGKHRFGVVGARAQMKMLAKMVKLVWDNEKTCRQYEQIMQKVRGKYFLDNLVKFKKAKDLYLDIKITNQLFDELSFLHQKTSSCSSFSQLMLTLIMMEGSQELTVEHQSDIAIMFGSCTNVESADIPNHLKNISKVIYKSGKHEEFTNVKPTDGVKWLENNCDEAFELFEDFIKNNYHRGFKELDLYSDTWGSNPELVIQMLQEILARYDPKLMDVEKKVLNEVETVALLKTPKKAATRKFLRKLLPIGRKSVQRREFTKSNLVAFVHEIRMAYRYLGEMMVREGLLPHKELIFFLTVQELNTVIKKRDCSLIIRAMRRQKSYKKWDEMQLPEFINGYPKDFDLQEEFVHDGSLTSDKIIRGTPVSTGTAVGRACVIKSFSEVNQIQSGDILITHHTDIGWSPYFPILGGVVTEIGGLISHGAVVAREYGLPCIVGVPGATNLFKTGDRIRLICESGILMKISNE